MHHARKTYGNSMELNIHTFLTSAMTRLHKKQKYLANIIHTHNNSRNNPNTRAYYIKCCKILSRVIKEAKKSITVDLCVEW
jgi:hypothetical protein